jgi:RimK family alpha-L-glutamate ligase
VNPRIALISDDPGWHGARLREAFAVRGREVCDVSLCDCAIDLTQTRHGLVVPGFEDDLPDGVFVRGVPGGTLEQVVLYLDLLHALHALDIPVYNSGRAIERSVDKGMTSLLLHQAGIPVPRTWVVSNPDQAQAVWTRERANGHRLVVKPLFGSQGTGITRLSANDVLPPLEDYQGVYYLQHFIEGSSHDWRVFVINGKAVASMQRHGNHWLNNVAQGARCIAAPYDVELEALAEAAAGALAMDYAGVDLMRDAGGVLQVIEVNGIPAWQGLQAACGVDIAEQLVDDFFVRYLLRRRVRAVGL